MNLSISVSNASLPETYQAAQFALSQCSQVDECKDWADKASALASYAKQSEDESLMKMAQRIRARAIRRAGELLQQIEPATGKNNQYEQVKGAGNHTFHSRDSAAREAGMSKHQQMQATRTANVPDADFESMIESDTPPTLSHLAAQGIKKRKPLVDLEGRDPKEFNMAMHYVGAFEMVARELEKQPHQAAIIILNEQERERLRAAIVRIDAITDKTITRI